jgi:hypothetical protein
MKAKRFLSGIVAVTMVFASVLSVNAAETVPEQSTEGKGAGEGYVNKYVRDVVVPTNALDFIVDPQGLLKASNSSTTKYKVGLNDVNKNNETDDRTEGFIYFSSLKSDGKTGIKSTFVDLVVENKSSYNVSVTPKITYTDGKVGKAAMGCTATVNSAAVVKTNLLFNMYLKEEAVATSDDGTGDGTGDGTSTSQTSGSGYDFFLINGKKSDNKTNVVPNLLNGIADCYVTTFDAKNGYKYALNTDKTKGTVYANLSATEKKALGNSVTYTLEGSSNPNATNWDTVIAKMNTKSTEDAVVVQPSLKITWTITDIK